MTRLQYLGIPLVAGVITRFTVMRLMSKRFLQDVFLPWFSPFALLGLLYTIVVMFAYQGHHIVHNLGPVFRVFVPMILYFVVMWTSAFSFIYYLARREARRRQSANATFEYEVAVVQAFTAGSNNFVSARSYCISRRRCRRRCFSFPAGRDASEHLLIFFFDQELAIAVAIAVYGVGSDQALAATIGPLVEVPVLLALTWVAQFLRTRLAWGGDRDRTMSVDKENGHVPETETGQGRGIEKNT